MLSKTHLGLGFDSAFARQQQDGFPWLVFSDELEPGFREAHFERTRPYVRAALFIGLALVLVIFVFGIVMGRPMGDGFSNFIRFGLLSPVLLATTTASFMPAHRRAFRMLVAMTAVTIGVSYVVLNLTSPPHLTQLGFAGLIVVIPFVYFALGLLLKAALLIVVAVTVIYVGGALAIGIPADILQYNTAILVVSNFICGMGSYMLEHSLRTGYLEGEMLGEMVQRDGLTGLLNRRAMDEHLDQVWAVARRQRCPVTIMMVDIDYFKAYNDRYGHQAGDECLRRVAQSVGAGARRALDFSGRYGGEEFLVVLFDATHEHAMKVATDITKRIQQLRVPHEKSPTAPFVTVSIGVATVVPAETERSMEGVVQLADRCLYKAKTDGRNRVEGEEACEAFIQTGIFDSGSA
jgi:diguanylate cyclase (GGDEF)-like protein